jgi:serine protease DegS
VQRRGRAFLGIQGGDDPNGRGCIVAAVEDGSAAANGGIRQQDVLTKFKGKPVPNFETLIDLIATTSPGDEVEAEVVRDGETLTLKVEMAGWR